MMETSRTESHWRVAAKEEPSAGDDRRTDHNSADLNTSRRRDDLIRDFDRTFGFTPPHANRSPSNAQPVQVRGGSDRVAPVDGEEQGQTVGEHVENPAGSPGRERFSDIHEASGSGTAMRHACRQGDGVASNLVSPAAMLARRMLLDGDSKQLHPMHHRGQSETSIGTPSGASYHLRSSSKFLPSPPSSHGTSPRPEDSKAEANVNGKIVSENEEEEDIDIWEKALVVLVVMGKRTATLQILILG